MKSSDAVIALGLAAINAVTLLVFGFDKWRASRGGGRIPEAWLVILGALGGWPGGLLGMILFRHKTSKGRFQFKYGLALIPLGAGIWAWRHWR